MKSRLSVLFGLESIGTLSGCTATPEPAPTVTITETTTVTATPIAEKPTAPVAPTTSALWP
jgi:hypothetical protein